MHYNTVEKQQKNPTASNPEHVTHVEMAPR